MTRIRLLKTLPDTPERIQQELTLQITLGVPLVATKGHGIPEVERVYTRARELCQQVGETPQLFPALYGLWRYYLLRAESQMGREMTEQLMSLAQPPGPLHRYFKSSFLKELSNDAIRTLVDFLAADPAHSSTVAIEHLGGAVSRVGERDTAFSHRRAPYSFLIVNQWKDPAESEKNIALARQLWKVMEPFLEAGVYVNYLSEDEGDDRVKAAYGPNYERLVAIKNKYDPTNFFRLNQNIKLTV